VRGAYALVLFIGAFFLAMFLWIPLNHVFSEVASVFINQAKTQAVKDNISLVANAVYYSLFFIGIFGLLWVVKSAIENGKNEYIR